MQVIKFQLYKFFQENSTRIQCLGCYSSVQRKLYNFQFVISCLTEKM